MRSIASCYFLTRENASSSKNHTQKGKKERQQTQYFKASCSASLLINTRVQQERKTREFKLKIINHLFFLYKSENSFHTHIQALINLISELLHSWVSWVDFTLLLKLDLSFYKQRSQETTSQHNPPFCGSIFVSSYQTHLSSSHRILLRKQKLTKFKYS